MQTMLQGALRASILALTLKGETTKKYRPKELHIQGTATIQRQIFEMPI